VGSRTALLISKKGALDSQPQVIKLTHGWWFSSCTTASCTTKTGRHDIAENWLKVALSTKKSMHQSMYSYRTLVHTNIKIPVLFLPTYVYCFPE
jgi:hypothetical protein